MLQVLGPVIALIAYYIYRFIHRNDIPTSEEQKRLAGRYQNRIIWITGASSGIGRALAHACAKCGAKVILSGRDVDSLQKVAKECIHLDRKENVSILPFDLMTVADNESKCESIVKEAIAVYGQVDILIANAGQSLRGSTQSTLLNVDHKIMNLNYFSTIALTKKLLPHLHSASTSTSSQKNPLSGIIAISSVQGLMGVGNRSAYAASKHALHGFYSSLRYETNDDDVRISIVCPGYVRTNLSMNALTSTGDQHAQLDLNNSQGFEPEVIAWRTLKAFDKNEYTIVIADLKAHIALLLSAIAPHTLAKIMRKRLQKELSASKQEEAKSDKSS